MTEGVDLPAWMMLLPGLVFLAAGLVALVGRSRAQLSALSCWITSAGGLVSVLVGVNALLRETPESLNGWSPAPAIDFAFRLDPLRAWFLIILGLPAIAAGVYALDYLAPRSDGVAHRPARYWTDATIALFLASVAFLIVADTAIAFLFFWEAMALLSFFLVMEDGHTLANRRAAWIYAVMTHTGSAFLVAMFLLLARNAGSLSFDDMRSAAETLGSTERHVIFVLALIGFGSKAGLIPMHIWLPRAEPLAPAHGAGLMSGVLAKTAVLGLVMTLFQFLGSPPMIWGGVLIAAGLVSALLGILYSLMERQSGRVLAWSTIEHLGIIVTAIGVATVLGAEGQAQLAALALVAALFHALNHAIFKSLLFMVTGAVQHAAGSRDLERLGGLIKRMPRTALVALAGVGAMAALPPLNGFASEWLLFQSVFSLGWSTNEGHIGTGAAIAAAILALTSALALAGAVRLFGMTFLAQPRSAGATSATETPRSMLWGMGFLSVCIVAVGVAPMVVVRLLEPVTRQLTGSVPVATPAWSASLDASRPAGNYLPVLVMLLLLVAGVMPWLLVRWRAGQAVERVSLTWVCGNLLQPRMQYTATAFAKPLRLIFQSVLRPDRKIVVERADSPYVTSAIHYEEEMKPVYERYIYEPLVAATLGSAKHVRRLQSGSLRLYLLFFFATLVVAIVMAR
ncbi:MAG: hypothetical protein KF883_10580 [Thermomicrobiales bacterium]|nr:hypothetical protein [Thermomicrobiales bacterium]